MNNIKNVISKFLRGNYIMVTFDQYLIQKANEWTIEGWPVGNLLLCFGALVLCIVLVGLLALKENGVVVALVSEHIY